FDEKGRLHKYHWLNDAPLNARPDENQVNFFQYWITNEQGKTTYRNSWVTDIYVFRQNVQALGKGGSARWKTAGSIFR
ncbi:MAG: hypothetical protein K9J79_11070, partial [Desulfobacteraceae bacterium]|nr:hypothetical protein [Desulfobacteraceae bacterium]